MSLSLAVASVEPGTATNEARRPASGTRQWAGWLDSPLLCRQTGAMGELGQQV